MDRKWIVTGNLLSSDKLSGTQVQHCCLVAKRIKAQRYKISSTRVTWPRKQQKTHQLKKQTNRNKNKQKNKTKGKKTTEIKINK